jgi:hypothetical protein
MKSYVLMLGQPAFDLVGTFDPVEDIASVGTVQEQDEFMRRHREEFEKRARLLGGVRAWVANRMPRVIEYVLERAEQRRGRSCSAVAG